MIITLCGSAQFEGSFHQWNEALTLKGHTVFSLAVFPSTKGDVKEWYTESQKVQIDLAHFAKIEASDAIVVLNMDGYIGESTRKEVIWAAMKNKQVYAADATSLVKDPGGFTCKVYNAWLLVPDGIPKAEPTLWTEGLATRVEPADVFSDEERFFNAMGQPRNNETVALYIKLILEEVAELLEAAAPQASLPVGEAFRKLHYFLERPAVGYFNGSNHDPVKVLDALMDIMVVTLNCGIASGYPLRDAWREVLRANMEKVNPDTGFVHRRADGKVLKPDGWVPPDERLRKLLDSTEGQTNV